MSPNSLGLLDTNWIGIVLSALVMLGGTAVNLFIIGRFVGQWSEAMKNMSSALTRVEAQVAEVTDQSESNQGKLQLMDQRLLVVEAATSRFWEMREQFVTLRVTVEMTTKRTEETMITVQKSILAIETSLKSIPAG